MKKQKTPLRLNQNVIDNYDSQFQRSIKVNTFYEKRVYVSRNIAANINIIYQMFGDLGCLPAKEMMMSPTLFLSGYLTESSSGLSGQKNSISPKE